MIMTDNQIDVPGASTEPQPGNPDDLYPEDEYDGRDGTPEEAMLGHEEHDTTWCSVGAPGTGNSIWCNTCERSLWSNVRILEPWEVM